MKHAFLDHYSHLLSPIHSLNPKAKIVAFFFFIIVVVTTPPPAYLTFASYFSILIFIFFLSKLPFGHVFGRSLLVIPFVLMIAIFIPFFKKDLIGGGYNLGLGRLSLSYSGLMILWNVAVKSYLGVLSMILLSSTTPFPRLLKGLEELKVPKVFTTIASFMYRYSFILIDEVQRMKRARDSRLFGGKWLWHAKIIGHMIASLFIRSYERGERIYGAMVSRGFEGTMKNAISKPLVFSDYLFLVIILTAVISIRFLV